MLAIYQQVGAQYKLPWEILAGIGKEECDHGRTPDPSCTAVPGAMGPGVTNCAGAWLRCASTAIRKRQTTSLLYWSWDDSPKLTA